MAGRVFEWEEEESEGRNVAGLKVGEKRSSALPPALLLSCSPALLLSCSPALLLSDLRSPISDLRSTVSDWRLMTDAQLREKLVQEGFRNVAGYSAESVAAQYAALYGEVLGRNFEKEQTE